MTVTVESQPWWRQAAVVKVQQQQGVTSVNVRAIGKQQVIASGKQQVESELRTRIKAASGAASNFCGVSALMKASDLVVVIWRDGCLLSQDFTKTKIIPALDIC